MLTKDVPINRHRQESVFFMKSTSARISICKILRNLYRHRQRSVDSWQNFSYCKLSVFWFQSAIVNSNCSKYTYFLQNSQFHII